MACSCLGARAQFADCSTGLLQMPSAEMQPDGMLMMTGHWLNEHSLPTSGWNYRTFQYGLAFSLWGRFELEYVCTLFDGRKTNKTEEYWRIMRNQDRHFSGRVLLLRENEFGLAWMPALVVGMSDPITSGGGKEYIYGNVKSMGNGYFNRSFIVLTKHFQTSLGEVGVHAGYQYSIRKDYSINAPCAGVNWKPMWLQNKSVLDNLNVIIEYDSRSVNLGVIVSVWENRFETMFEVQNLQWINFGFRYKLRIKA